MVKKNPRLEFVKRELTKRKGTLPLIAASTGVPHTTIKNIESGISKNPMSNNLDRLFDYLRSA